MSSGKLYIVGIGPGGLEHLTPKAKGIIDEAQVIIGYKTYLDLIEPLLMGKEVISSGMRQERDRCARAIGLAASGKIVALISGGDPGIYGMAGLVFELASSTPPDRLPLFEVIPGIAALNACASRLGAPLMHDFASISLSDLLTPREVIEKRLEAASAADFVIVLYNPKSKARTEQIVKARDIVLKYRHGNTPVGIVRHATRADETITITMLSKMLDNHIDMQSTVIIGNSQTFVWQGLLVTPRGYTTQVDRL
ncbi:MAG TPA: precorrin-3B C(17)-methyltransferase [Deltaproteobacteria bacterium]|nr:precorrin-3B C(17)-methyltransferase [Deltaproteobacteria bacterium]